MKLELKHLQPYPSTLKIECEGIYCRFEGIDFDNDSVILERINVPLDEIKLILRPLSDLTKKDNTLIDSWKKQDSFGSFFRKFEDITLDRIPVLEYRIIVSLLQNHYDIFGLIEKGLAIDINTIK
jgi:hypothetical protein